MKKKNGFIVGLILLGVSFVLATGRVAFSAPSSSSAEALAAAAKEKEKPIIIQEWDKAWGQLWLKEAGELKKKGVSEDKIIAQYNPLAAERVATVLKMDKDEVMKQVNAYFTKLQEEEARKKKK